MAGGYFTPDYFPPSYFGGATGDAAAVVAPATAGGPFFPAAYFPAPYFGGAFGAPTALLVIAPGPLEPDPDETAWTLGFGGAAWDGRVVPGYGLALAATLLNNGAVVPYLPADVLDAQVWPGGALGVTFAPPVAWDLANGGAPAGRVALAIVGNSTVALDAGEYRLRLGVTVAATGARALAFDGPLRVGAIPGTASSTLTACSYADLLLYGDRVASLSARSGADASGFLNQRAKETAEFFRDLMLRYQPEQGMARVRRDVVDPIVGQDVPTAMTPAPRSAVAAALAAGGLILEAKAREIVARRSVALVYERQMDRDSVAEAARQRGIAADLFRAFVAQVDLNGDGVPDVLIHRDCTFLPTGTAP